MPITKQNLPLPFASGVDQKTDSVQVQPGSMEALSNALFQKSGAIKKRSGFAPLTTLPAGTAATTLATFQGNLQAIGSSLLAYNEDSNQWVGRGPILPVSLSTQTILRTSYSQSAVDLAVASSGQGVTVFLDGDGLYKYQVSDTLTGQTLVDITALPATATQARVFALGGYFIVTFIATVGGGPHLQYIAIPQSNPTAPLAATDISTSISGLTAGYDGAILNGSLVLAWNGSDGGGAIRVVKMGPTLVISGAKVISGVTATNFMSVATNPSTNVVWVTGYTNSGNALVCYSLDTNLNILTSGSSTVTGATFVALTSTVASNGLLTIYAQVVNSYTYTPTNPPYTQTRSDFIVGIPVSSNGSIFGSSTLLRSVGLASKAFSLNGVNYMLASYAGTFQPTYFLIDGSGNTVAKLSYSNGAGYVTTQVLPAANVVGNNITIGYLLKDLIASVNKSQGVAAVSNVYSQTGVNLVNFNLSQANLINVEIGGSLNLAGGFLWMYDGVRPVEQNFHLWPEDLTITSATSGGFLTAQSYQYQFCYEWTDGSGNIHRSAPSIPFTIATTGSTSLNTIKVPTLRLTAKKAPNNIRIVGYRWSTAQQTFYQFTSITAPTLNDPTSDNVTFTDGQADNAILGNNILYTTGGVVENIAPPSTSLLTLYGSRLFLVNAEDPNTLWYSKQVIQATPVEMSDLFTLYIPPTQASQGSTGPITALSTMDDKLIIFKANAIYYITGIGPDNTGASNDFGTPTFIASTVGCSNPQSIVFTPNGLMFQSGKGIWLLGRDLSTTYIGAQVESYNGMPVLAAFNINGTNHVRFQLTGAISGTLYKGLHTILDASGKVSQEAMGIYSDNTVGTMLMYNYYYGQWGTFTLANGPVTMSFTTAWLNLAGVQGYQRAYFFYLLGQYASPHTLSVGIAYDYNTSVLQQVTINPTNYSNNYGLTQAYGQNTPYGGPSNLEQWRVFFSKQKTQAFQITVTEFFDPSKGTLPGAGLTFNHMNLVVGVKKGYRAISNSESIG